MNINPPRHGNGTTQACAACKYQRRKCAPDCILAPYFPHDRQRQFLNAHKLFGVSNITKAIKHLDQPEKDEAMRTIIFQSDMRANDPVGGCYRMIRDLQRLIDYNKAELEIVLHQLAMCRAQAHHQQQQQMPEVTDPPILINSENHVINNNNSAAADDPLGSYNNNGVQFHYLGVPPAHQEQYFFVNNDNLEEDDVSAWAVQADQSHASINLSSLHVKNVDVGDDQCDDIKPIFERNEIKLEAGHHDHDHDQENVHERSYEAMLRIDNSILKEEDGSIQQAQDHDLKGAATLFTLTNCNS